MKFIVRILIFFIVVNTTFSELKDGVYSVRDSKTTWFLYPYTEIIVKNGKVIKISHDKVNKKWERASKYKFLSKKLKNKINYLEKTLSENYFKVNGDINKIDNIAGATESVNAFKKQYKFLIKQKNPGRYIMKE